MTAIPSSLLPVIGRLVAGNAPWPLVLLGGVGTGKTCSALVLCDHVPLSLYMTLRDLLDQVIACDKGIASWRDHDGHSGTLTTKMFWQQVERTPLFVLDEMGMRDRVSDFAYETLFKLIETRAGTPFVVISNLSIGQIAEAFDDRIVSRLQVGTVINMAGKDRREEARRCP